MTQISNSWPRSHEERPLRVLSVQSHVCRDYVGNRAAVPVFQSCGIHVDAVNTTNLASAFVHRGTKESSASEIFVGLRHAAQLPRGGGFPGALVEDPPGVYLDYDLWISGYIGYSSYLQSYLEALRMNKEAESGDTKKGLVVIDPVLGDNGRFYVSEELTAAYRDAFQYADVITPNQFELQWLAGETHPIKTKKDMMRCLDTVSAYGPKFIICTSMPCEKSDEQLVTTLYCATTKESVSWSYAKIPIMIYGAGDTFAASLATAMLAVGPSHDLNSMRQSVKQALIYTQVVLKVTKDSVEFSCLEPSQQWPTVNVVACRDTMCKILNCDTDRFITKASADIRCTSI